MTKLLAGLWFLFSGWLLKKMLENEKTPFALAFGVAAFIFFAPLILAIFFWHH